MKNILETIADKTKERIEEAKRKKTLKELRLEAESKKDGEPFIFEKSISRKGGINFICEVKKASPSKGVIAQNFPYTDIAKEYEEAGASAISCLTEPFFFMGSDEYLKAVKETVSVPILRKDFTVDEYMIYEAKAMGAGGVLLIAAILNKPQLRDYALLADSLGISAVTEVHDEKEAETALETGAKIIGANNRDLKTFAVDIGVSLRIKKIIPDNIVFVAESGIKKRSDIIMLEEAGVNAVLIGESLMREKDKAAAIKRLKGDI